MLSDALGGEVVPQEATCEWGTAPDCLKVRVPAGLVAKAGHVPPNRGTTSEEKASIPVSAPVNGNNCLNAAVFVFCYPSHCIF